MITGCVFTQQVLFPADVMPLLFKAGADSISAPYPQGRNEFCRATTQGAPAQVAIFMGEKIDGVFFVFKPDKSRTSTI